MARYIHELDDRPKFRWGQERLADKLAAVSRHQGRLVDTALRDIDDLVKRGILVKQAAGGRSTSYSLADIA